VTQESDQNGIHFFVSENPNLIELDTEEPSWIPAQINLFYAYLALADEAAGTEFYLLVKQTPPAALSTQQKSCCQSTCKHLFDLAVFCSAN